MPNCVSYDPTFQYEVAVIVQDGLRRMYQEQEDIFYYLTVMNENYEHPEMPAGAEGHPSGHVPVQEGCRRKGKGCAARATARLGHDLPRRSSPPPNCSSRIGRRCRHLGLPSMNELAQRQRRLALEPAQPAEKPKLSHVEQCLNDTRGPVIAATDYVRLYSEQIRPSSIVAT